MSESKPLRFGVIGEYQSGKSLLINCLLQRYIATVGEGCATTHAVVNYLYGESEKIVCEIKGKKCSYNIDRLRDLDTRQDIDEINVYLSCPLLRNFTLTDLPGFGANSEDNIATNNVLSSIDFAIVLAANDKELGGISSTFKDIQTLSQHKIPFYLLLNCRNRDRWACGDPKNKVIAQRNLSLLDSDKPLLYPLNDDGINIVNLMLYWISISDQSDELINREDVQDLIWKYKLNSVSSETIYKASNFELLDRLFSMENKGFLELRREFKDALESLKEEICPVGTIQAFAFNKIPQGWLVCNGQSVSRVSYPKLYAVIGNTFTTGTSLNAHDLFKLPDLRGRFVRGWSDDASIDANRKFGSIQDDALQGHIHSVESCSKNGGHYHYVYFCEKGIDEANTFYSRFYYNIVSDSNSSDNHHETDRDGEHTHEIKLGDAKSSTFGSLRVASETRPANVALLYCIRAE